VLVIDNQERRFDLADVRSIQKRGDSLKNGAIAGAIVGVLGGLLIGGLGTCEPPPGVVVECKDVSPVAIAVVGGLVYGAIGAGIDALVQGRTTLYQAPVVTRPVQRPALLTLRLRW
jgi:hypothetical protein